MGGGSPTCPTCGAGLGADDGRFCSHCGAELGELLIGAATRGPDLSPARFAAAAGRADVGAARAQRGGASWAAPVGLPLVMLAFVGFFALVWFGVMPAARDRMFDLAAGGVCTIIAVAAVALLITGIRNVLQPVEIVEGVVVDLRREASGSVNGRPILRELVTIEDASHHRHEVHTLGAPVAVGDYAVARIQGPLTATFDRFAVEETT